MRKNNFSIPLIGEYYFKHKNENFPKLLCNSLTEFFRFAAPFSNLFTNIYLAFKLMFLIIFSGLIVYFKMNLKVAYFK